MVRLKILQMGLEHAKEKIDIVGRLRNFKNAFVNLFVRKRDLQRQFFCYEINPAQPQRELLQKPAEHEKERLGGFNFILKLKALLERLRRPNQFEHSIALAISALPHSDCFGPKSRAKLLLIKHCQLAKSMNPPLVQDFDDLLNFSLSIFLRGCLRQIRALHALKFKARLGMFKGTFSDP